MRIQAPKGRITPVHHAPHSMRIVHRGLGFAPSGLMNRQKWDRSAPGPRAAPWANILRPFGAYVFMINGGPDPGLRPGLTSFAPKGRITPVHHAPHGMGMVDRGLGFAPVGRMNGEKWDRSAPPRPQGFALGSHPSPLRGLCFHDQRASRPRAAPWANLLRPFGADEWVKMGPIPLPGPRAAPWADILRPEGAKHPSPGRSPGSGPTP